MTLLSMRMQTTDTYILYVDFHWWLSSIQGRLIKFALLRVYMMTYL